MNGKLITVRRMLEVVNDLIDEIGEFGTVEDDLDPSSAEDNSGIGEKIELVRQLVYLSQEFSYRVQRFVGRLLNKVISHGGDRRSPESNCQPSLAKTGISRYAANRYRAIAQMSDERWEECMTQVREKGRLIKDSDLRPACDGPEPSGDLSSDSPDPTLGRAAANLVAEGTTCHTIFVSGEDLSDSGAARREEGNGRMTGPFQWQDLQQVPFQELLDPGGRVAVQVTAGQLDQATSALRKAGLTCTEIHGFRSSYDDGGKQWYRLENVLLIAQREVEPSPRGRRMRLIRHEAAARDALRKLLEQGGEGARLDLLGTTNWTDWLSPVPSG